MKNKIAELSILYEISSISNRISSEEELFDICVNKAVRLLGNDNCIIYSFNRDKTVLKPVNPGKKSSVLMVKEVSVSDTDFKLGKLLSENENYVLHEGDAGLLKKPYIPGWGLLLPLKVNRDIYGYIYVLRFSKERKFQYKDINLLNILRDKIELTLDILKSREELNLQHKLLKTMIDNIPVAVYMKEVINGEPCYVAWNRSFEKIFRNLDISRDLGKSAGELFSPETAEKIIQDDYLAMNNGKSIDKEEIFGEGDELLTVYNYKIPLTDNNGKTKYIIGLIEDITEKKKMEEDQREIQKLEAVSKLAGGVAHEFNNIMAGIMGIAELLLYNPEIDHKHAESFKNIISLTERASGLTQQLLTFARDGTVLMQNLDIHFCIHEALDIFQREGSKKIIISTDLNAESSNINGNNSMIVNLFLNLFKNSADAMGNSGDLFIRSYNLKPNSDKKRELKLLSIQDHFICVEVCDNGKGISPEIKEKVFEPFFSTKGLGAATGLGLSTVYGTVLKHEGSILIDSKEGRGSCFYLYFPLMELPAKKQAAL